MTYLCNAKCKFCTAPFKQEDKIISAFGNDPEVILRYLKSNQFNGISFSGGDCFLVYNRLLEWLTYYKKNLPDFYFWAYTNGLSVDEDKMKQLANSGLNELRFNIAATNYNSTEIIEIIKIATQIFNHVAIEIPSIPSDFNNVNS